MERVNYEFRTVEQPKENDPQPEFRLGIVRSVEGGTQPVPDAEVGVIGLDTIGGLERPAETREGVFDLDKLSADEIKEIVLAFAPEVELVNQPGYEPTSRDVGRADMATGMLRTLRNDMRHLVGRQFPEFQRNVVDERFESGLVTRNMMSKAYELFLALAHSGDSLAARIAADALGMPMLKKRQDEGGFEATIDLLGDWTEPLMNESAEYKSRRDAVVDSLSDVARRADWLDKDVRRAVEGMIDKANKIDNEATAS